MKKVGMVFMPVLGFLGRFRDYLFIGLLIAGLIGCGYRLSRILAVEPDQAYIDEQIQNLQKNRLRFDPKATETLRSLDPVPVSLPSAAPGKADPFN